MVTTRTAKRRRRGLMMRVLQAGRRRGGLASLFDEIITAPPPRGREAPGEGNADSSATNTVGLSATVEERPQGYDRIEGSKSPRCFRSEGHEAPSAPRVRRESRTYIMVDEKGRCVHILNSYSARGAALKAASRGWSNILLLEANGKFHAFEGGVRPLTENEITRFTSQHGIKSKPIVRKVDYVNLNNRTSRASAFTKNRGKLSLLGRNPLTQLRPGEREICVAAASPLTGPPQLD